MEVNGHKVFIRHAWDQRKAEDLHRKQGRGMTVVCVRDPDVRYMDTWVNNPRVLVSIAWCSKHDSYSRKKGVATALAKDPVSILVKDLPKYIEQEAKEKYSPMSFAAGWRGFALSML